MKKTSLMILLLITITAAVSFPSDNIRPCTIDITVKGLTNNRGKLAVAVFRSQKGFPEDDKSAYRKWYDSVKGKSANISFEKLPPGKYAVSVLHDENSNTRMDRNFFGAPKEGYGVSKNVRTFMRAPRFDEAAVNITTGTLKLDIKLVYPGD